MKTCLTRCVLYIFFVCTCINASFFSNHALAQFSIEDINILVEEKNYQEALTHFKSIPPTQRNTTWEKLLHQTANGLLDFYEQSNKFFEAWEEAYHLSISYASLREDPKFQKRKLNNAHQALTVFSKNNTDMCYDAWQTAHTILEKDRSIRSNRDFLDKYVEYAICHVNKNTWHRPTEIFVQVLKVDSSEKTRFMLAKAFHDNQQFVETVIFKKPKSYAKNKDAFQLMLYYLESINVDSSEHQQAIKLIAQHFVAHFKTDLENILTSEKKSTTNTIQNAYLILSESGQFSKTVETEYHLKNLLKPVWMMNDINSKIESLDYLNKQPKSKLSSLETKLLLFYQNKHNTDHVLDYLEKIDDKIQINKISQLLKNKLPKMYQALNKDCTTIRNKDFYANHTNLIHEDTCKQLFPVLQTSK